MHRDYHGCCSHCYHDIPEECDAAVVVNSNMPPYLAVNMWKRVS